MGANMREAFVIFRKQVRDTLKNKEILIQFVLLPVLAVIMENAVKIEGMPENYFIKLFSVMFAGMAPLVSMAAILAEEKEKGTLRVLLMSDVSPFSYLLGTGTYLWLLCMAGSAVMAAAAGFGVWQLMVYLSVMGAGLAVSVAAGAALGMFARSQMMATSLVMPVMLVLAFLPMLSAFQETVRKVAGIFYTRQMQIFLEDLRFDRMDFKGAAIMVGNLAMVCLLFIIAYKRNGLERE